jgi:hypothetical protein
MILSAEFSYDFIVFLGGSRGCPIEVHCSHPYKLRDINGCRPTAILILSLLDYMEAAARYSPMVTICSTQLRSTGSSPSREEEDEGEVEWEEEAKSEKE